MLNENLTKLIKSCKIFYSLNRKACEAILAVTKTIQLQPQEILFKDGDPSDYFYVLLHGELIATTFDLEGRETIIGRIEAGEVVGELGALSGEPRSLTVSAVKDSQLLKITMENFQKLYREYPSILLEILKTVIARSQKTIRIFSSKKLSDYIVFIPANENINLDTFKNTLQNCLDDKSDIVIADSNYSLDELKKIENENKTILFFAEQNQQELSYLDQTKNAYLIGNTQDEVRLSYFAQEILAKLEVRGLRYDLLLLHDDLPIAKNMTEKWLAKGKFFRHLHVRKKYKPDYERLLRFAQGTTVGLVLGGGGARGWLHLGVIKALKEMNVPIDAIGGTSIGALVAGCYLIDETYEGTKKNYDYVIDKTSPPFAFRNFTWPSISILNGKAFTNAVQELFNDLRIEDFWTSYFCVASNLSSQSEEICSRGLMWEKIRASVSLPGILPPVVMNGQLHLDGGLLNNLPVDVMRNYLGIHSKIIAVKLSSFPFQHIEYFFPPVLTFRENLSRILGFKKTNYVMPPFVDTFLNALLLGSSYREEQNTLAADVIIHPDLGNYATLNVNKACEARLIDIGYQEAISKFDYKITAE